MAVSEGLFRGQDQSAQALESSPGWTIDEQKPQFWDSFGLLPVMTGIGSGVANGVATLANGLKFSQEPDEFAPSEAAYQASKGELPPWQKKVNDVLDSIETQARAGAKSLMPDPKTTGTAANILNGFARSVTEFGAGTLSAGPVGGAAVLGGTEAYSRYHDLRDQGVDDETAKRSALITGITNAAGALTPFSLPAKLLEPLSAAGAFLTQTGAGAAINTSMGAASRLADSAILRHAGYPDMADQAKPWDEANLLTDAVTGAFFGAHAGFEGLRDTAVGPQARDAAAVVHDHQEIINRAPGVPVDMASAAIHREALQSALTDLMQNKPVSLDERVDGATFARPDQDTEISRSIIKEEFDKAGVLADAEEFDRWLKGETVPRETLPPEKPTEAGEVLTPESVQARLVDAQGRLALAGEEPKPEERAAAIEQEKERLTTPESVRERLQATYGEDIARVVAERAETPFKEVDEARKQAQSDLEKAQADQEQLARAADPAQAALAARPDMELPTDGKPVKAADTLEAARMESEQVDREADTAFMTAAACASRYE